MSFDISGALIEKKEFTEFKPLGREDSMNPLIGVFPTRDGRAFVLMCLQPDLYWPKVCQALEREDLVDDPRFNTLEARAENRIQLFELLDEAFMGKELVEWKSIFARIPSAPIQNLLEIIDDPHARANDLFVTLGHPEYGPIEVVAPPVKLSETPATVRQAAPELSQHTEEIVLELGYTREDIQRFVEDGVIAAFSKKPEVSR
ncbi:MAG: CoA transferase, partial [Planctomycetota bacterium]|jgi:crotonobetainyl-CoA:carnitine CoA-transferase CaiB-like acyl-CoA transferase